MQKLYPAVTERFARNISAVTKSIETRQTRRAHARLVSQAEVDSRWGPEPRRLRRIFARLRAKF